MEAQENSNSLAPLTWDMDECSKQIGVSRRTLSRFVNNQEIPVVRIGSRVLFRPEAVMQWLAEKEVKPI